ncbi:MAG: toxin regulator [Terrisporobacter othiniensis]|uniref:toxin regulator n=1 Tax=Terrisporobacter othiniensis TaxID=1577792 RepID=UPI00290DAE3A|nr:toxin regulator [Terrisporobacter othiniensis]MDU6983953.1 toxin regulator [Terrisporobacter othiniensis]
MKLLEKLKEKKNIKTIIAVVIGIFVGGLFSPLCSDRSHEGVEEKISKLESSIKEKDAEIETLNAKVDSAAPWFEMKEEEQKAIEEKNEKLKAEEEAKKKQEEEEAKKLAEEEEKKGYDTGIGYKDLARNPKDYVGKKIKFKGKVIQVMEGDGEVQIRLAVNDDYDNIIYGVYDSSIVSSRVLEDDYITVMGVSTDLLTYESTMGGEITIPSMLVQRIEMK